MNAVLIDVEDNVVTLTEPVRSGEAVVWPGGSVRATHDVASGHKVAIRLIPKGGRVVKYGQPIGLATAQLAPGEHVHSHCLKPEPSTWAS